MINKGWIVGLGILLVISIGINFYFYNNQVELPEEKALLDVQVYQWAENLYDSSEMFFDYWIYNYGNVEARNVIVECNLFESDGETKRVSVTNNYGNLASESSGFGEITTEKPFFEEDEGFIGLCHVESCDNCEILYKKIPKLIEDYE